LNNQPNYRRKPRNYKEELEAELESLKNENSFLKSQTISRSKRNEFISKLTELNKLAEEIK